MTNTAPFLSVIIPAYNETRNFERGTMSEVFDYLRSQDYSFEMILVDDGSTDNTLDLLRAFAMEKPQIRVLGQPHRGKAATVKAGMLAATGQNRLFTDFDQSTPISEVEKLLPFRRKKYEVVIGSREVKGARREDEPWYRHLMGKGFNWVVQLFAVTGIHDTQCGFKLFSANATERLFPQLKVTVKPKKDPFTGAFDVELLFLAQKYNLAVAEVPVIWHHHHSERVSPVKDSLRMFFEVIKIRLAALVRSYA